MDASLPLSEVTIAARIERLPPSAWHVRMRIIIGMATFFDAFDLITIATILPTLVNLWKLTPPQIGWLISIGFAGQAVGAIGFGYLAERIGRVRVAIICISIFSVLSILCAFANTYDQLVWLRFFQGVGLGGEVPIAATYINEIAKSHKRGRFFLLYECVFLLGVAVYSLVGAYVVPRFGYHWMFVSWRRSGSHPDSFATVLPGISALACLARQTRRGGQEPDRDREYYRSNSRASDTRCLGRVHVPQLTAIPDGLSCLKGDTGNEHSWSGCSGSAHICSPTAFRRGHRPYTREIFILPLSPLWFGAIGTVVSLAAGLVCALLVDRVGRKLWMTCAFAVTAIPLVILGYTSSPALFETVSFATIGQGCVVTVTIILYLYTPELYPTRMRALGTSWATFWPRVASIVGASMVGYVLPTYGINGVFAVFGVIALIGCVVCFLGGIQTRERILEELSP